MPKSKVGNAHQEGGKRHLQYPNYETKKKYIIDSPDRMNIETHNTKRPNLGKKEQTHDHLSKKVDYIKGLI